MSEASKKMTIEESFEYLDEVIGRMEDPDVTWRNHLPSTKRE